MKDQLYSELAETRRTSIKEQEKIEPTEEEKKNGWTAESLTAYLAERKAAQSLGIDVNSFYRKSLQRPMAQNHKYNPLRWRSG